ncbi:MAG: O-antigen ligase family protein [Rhizobiaceae bacterium]|nr:O-antigen ligase family protein [Rhizobiaceae bacterium]
MGVDLPVSTFSGKDRRSFVSLKPAFLSESLPRVSEGVKASIRDGNISVFLTLALCLAVPFGGVGIVAVVSVMTIAASRGRLIGEAVKLYFGPWLKSDAFALNLLILIVTLIELGLVLYHGDGTGDLENQAKQYFMALAVLLTIRRFPVGVVLWGAAVGCLLGAVVASTDLWILGLERAEGPTNPIRFGMLAALFSMFALIGAVYAQGKPWMRVLMAGAACVGMFAVFASGSRGAVLAVPAMLLPLLPRLWAASRSTALIACALFVLFPVALGLWQSSMIRTDRSDLGQAAGALVNGEVVQEESARNRVEMLRIARELFLAHPIAGAGSHGWDEAVDEQIRTSPAGVALDQAYNQPHNQYANDFAKGGLLRGLPGIAMLLMPLWLFIRRGAFGKDDGAIAPLLGVVTCAAFIVFCMTESAMDLSLTTSIYAILIFYLIAAAEGAPLSAPKRRESRQTTG